MIGRDMTRVLRPGGTAPVTAYQLQKVTALEPDARLPEEPGAEREAYERGVAAGEQRVREEAVGLIAQQNGLLAALVQELRLYRDSVLNGAEEAVAALALAIAGKVLHDQGDTLREAIQSQAREAVSRIREGGPVKIRVHPCDAPLLEPACEAITKAFNGDVTLQIESDPKLTRGGCLVETAVRLIDARIEVQLARIGQALRQNATWEGRGPNTSRDRCAGQGTV